MKRQILMVSLLASLVGAGAAWSAPDDLEARRQALESQRKGLDTEIQRLASEMDARAQQMDPAARLTSDQLFELLQAREQRLADKSPDPSPILFSLALFSTAMVSFVAWLIASDRKARRLHETVRLMVEKGAEIPPGLLVPAPKRKPSDLRRGIILSTSGLGLAVFLAVLPDMDGAWGAGVTLLLIGLGHLLVWRLQQGKGPVASALATEWQS